MAKRQTRRSLSVKGITYRRLMELAQRLGQSGSAVVEELIHARCEQAGVPMPTEPLPPKPKPRPETTTEEIASQHFTF